MRVIKRNGKYEAVNFEKITARIRKLCYELDPIVDPCMIAQKTITGLYDLVSVSQIDELAAETAAYMSTHHPDFSKLAARISVSNLHKSTDKTFSDVIMKLFNNKSNCEDAPLVSKEVYDIVQENAEVLNASLVYDHDFNYDYFGFKTLERSYLLRINKEVVERPQHLHMRVAIGIHKKNISKAIETYRMLAQGWFTHATPTMFNAGTPNAQMSSCFLTYMQDDSIHGIFETLKSCALISKGAGGIGLSVSSIRGKGSYIKGSGGTSNGLVPMLKVFDNTARYVDQGGGKRKGAFAMYVEPWHPDVERILDLKKNTGKEENRARDLFYAMWIPDLFMRRVEAEGTWSLFCPSVCGDLMHCFGKEFETKYEQYEAEQKYTKQMHARDLWYQILESQMETGGPYMLYKDSANIKSNHNHMGTITCSNLCTEIIEYTSKEETAVCNLASIALTKFVTDSIFDHKKLFEVTYVVTNNLNCIINENYYPIPQAEYSNKKNRPIGIGVQGLADAFALLRMAFDSDEAAKLNKEIFETIYFAALTCSCDLAENYGAYKSYKGCLVDQGKLQFDMWGVVPSDRWDWTSLRKKISEYGIRNSLLLAPMPTASTAQILGNNECFEPFTTNIYLRRVLSGEFPIVNKYLLNDLIALGLWDADMREELLKNNGSVQNISRIPDDVKILYKTVWEISQKTLINMACERGAFIDQSQSFNVFIAEPTISKLSSMHFYGWKKGLKTGMYYLRSKPASETIKFTVSATSAKKEKEPEATYCTREEGCVTCSA